MSEDATGDPHELKFGLFDLTVAHPSGFTYEDAQRHFGWPSGTGPAIPADGWHSFVVRCVLAVVNESSDPMSSGEVYERIKPSRRYQLPGGETVRIALKALAKSGQIRRVPRVIGGRSIITWQPLTMPDPGPEAAWPPPPLDPSPVRDFLLTSGPQPKPAIASALGLSKNYVGRALFQLTEAGEVRMEDGLFSCKESLA